MKKIHTLTTKQLSALWILGVSAWLWALSVTAQSFDFTLSLLYILQGVVLNELREASALSVLAAVLTIVIPLTLAVVTAVWRRHRKVRGGGY